MHPKIVSKPIRAQPSEQKAYNPKQTPNKTLFELIVYLVSTSLFPPPLPNTHTQKNQFTTNASSCNKIKTICPKPIKQTILLTKSSKRPMHEYHNQTYNKFLATIS